MSELEVPDLTWPEKFIRDLLLPFLPSSWKGYGDLEGKEVEVAQAILAQEYAEHGHLSGIWKVIVLVVLYDILFHLPPIVYGLILSANGSLYLAMPAMHTPNSLAGDSVERADDIVGQIRQDARESVKTNVGLLPLTAGFVVQIFAVVGLFRSELVPTNYLTGSIPAIVGFGFIAVVGWVWTKVR